MSGEISPEGASEIVGTEGAERATIGSRKAQRRPGGTVPRSGSDVCQVDAGGVGVPLPEGMPWVFESASVPTP